MADGGIDWKSLSVDKAIDAILIPVGLFAALWFQGWVDEKKEKEDYAALIADFRTEVGANREKVKVLEADVGPVAELEPDKVLGPLQKQLDEMKADSEQLSAVFDCVDTYFELAIRAPTLLKTAPTPAPAPTPVPAPGEAPAPADAPAAEAAADAPAADAPEIGEEDAAMLATCAEVLDKFEKQAPKRFVGVDLSPFYGYVVWTVYLQNGIKLFKDKEAKRVGLKLGEVYASQKEVEHRLDDIETLFNESLMKSSGKLAALIAESGDLIPDEPTDEDFKAAQPRIQDMSQEAFDLRYEIENTRNVLSLKVTRLKTYLTEMSALQDEAIKALDTEQGRVGAPK